MKDYHEDDRLIIPEDIKCMSKEELQAEIAKLEAEERSKSESVRISA